MYAEPYVRILLFTKLQPYYLYCAESITHSIFNCKTMLINHGVSDTNGPVVSGAAQAREVTCGQEWGESISAMAATSH